jgi:hypothetical protein
MPSERRSAGLAGSSPDLERLREAIVRAGRRLGARGFIAAGEGNLSIRLPGDRLLVTPSGVRKDELVTRPPEAVARPRKPRREGER